MLTTVTVLSGSAEPRFFEVDAGDLPALFAWAQTLCLPDTVIGWTDGSHALRAERFGRRPARC
jgi:hypothetical protein